MSSNDRCYDNKFEKDDGKSCFKIDLMFSEAVLNQNTQIGGTTSGTQKSSVSGESVNVHDGSGLHYANFPQNAFLRHKIPLSTGCHLSPKP